MSAPTHGSISGYPPGIGDIASCRMLPALQKQMAFGTSQERSGGEFSVAPLSPSSLVDGYLSMELATGGIPHMVGGGQ